MPGPDEIERARREERERNVREYGDPLGLLGKLFPPAEVPPVEAVADVMRREHDALVAAQAKANAAHRRRKTLAVDFDGVLHAYTSPWTKPEEIHDGPVPGAVQFLCAARERFEVVICSVRAETPQGREAMRTWLCEHIGNPEAGAWFRITHEKPKAVVYLDDRAVCFTGRFPSLDALDAFVPWNRCPAQEVPHAVAPESAPQQAEGPGGAKTARERAVEALRILPMGQTNTALHALEAAGLVVVDVESLDAILDRCEPRWPARPADDEHPGDPAGACCMVCDASVEGDDDMPIPHELDCCVRALRDAMPRPERG